MTLSDKERPLWRTSLTFAVVLISLCAGLRYELSGVLDRFSPNLAEVLSYSLLILSVGMANVYLDALTDPAPSWRASRHHVVIATALVGAILLSWSLIPGAHEYVVQPGINRLPMSVPLLVFNLAAFGSLIPVGARVIAFCRQKIRSNRKAPSSPEPGSYAGLTLIWAFSLAGLAGCLDVVLTSLWRLPSAAPLPADSFHLKFPPAANAVCLTGLTSGVVVLLLGPRLQSWRESRDLARLIEPLWRCLVQQHPQVKLEGRHTVTRRLIEVHDALALHRIPERDSRDFHGIAAAVQRGDGGDVLAGRALAELDPSDTAVARLATAFNEGTNERARDT